MIIGNTMFMMKEKMKERMNLEIEKILNDSAVEFKVMLKDYSDKIVDETLDFAFLKCNHK